VRLLRRCNLPKKKGQKGESREKKQKTKEKQEMINI